MYKRGFIPLVMVMVLFTGLILAASGQYTKSGVMSLSNQQYIEKYFQKDKVMTVDIQISEDDWDDILANASLEEYKTGTVVVNGDVYPLVNVRAKGNSSLSSVAHSDSSRYSFKINFGDLIENQTLEGLTQLNLNNCFSDLSYMREYLSYQIFEEMGVPVPAFAYAAVYVNGEYFGLYLAVESILEPYLAQNFGDVTGDLYKSVGNTLKYNGDSKSDYSGLEVKSSLKNADWSKLIKMLDVLNNGGDDIEKYLDVDQALKYIAVNTALANFDSYLGNFGHNYYLYEQGGVFTILPWDLNMSFGGFGGSGGIYIDEPVQGTVADRPLVAKLLENEKYRETYHEYLLQMVTGYLQGEYLQDETSRLFDLISEYVKTDPTAFYTYQQFEESIAGTIEGGVMAEEEEQNFLQAPSGAGGLGKNVPGIMELAATAGDSILKQLRGEMPSTNSGNGSDGMKGKGGDQQRPMPEGEGTGGQQFPAMEGGRPPAGRNNEGNQRPNMQAAPPGMALPDDIGREELEEFRHKIQEEGSLTDQLKEEAKELGIPDELLEMMAGDQGNMRPGDGEDRFRPDGMQPGGKKDRASDSDVQPAGWLIPSTAAIIAAIVLAWLFKRRR
ncbi:MAG: spore coat protein [Syntrophomonadaceae bacterium]|nr:spore coat protein [Syntrophomonadaceae bacterium]